MKRKHWILLVSCLILGILCQVFSLVLSGYGQTPVIIAPPMLRIPPGIRGMRGELTALTVEVAAVKADNLLLRTEMDALTVEVAAVKAENVLLRTEMDAVSARSALLATGQLVTVGVLRLRQASDLASASAEAVGWYAFVLDADAPGGERGVPRDEHVSNLEAAIAESDIHLSALSAP